MNQQQLDDHTKELLELTKDYSASELDKFVTFVKSLHEAKRSQRIA